MRGSLGREAICAGYCRDDRKPFSPWIHIPFWDYQRSTQPHSNIGKSSYQNERFYLLLHRRELESGKVLTRNFYYPPTLSLLSISPAVVPGPSWHGLQGTCTQIRWGCTCSNRAGWLSLFAHFRISAWSSMSAVDDSLLSYLTGSEDWPLLMAICKLFKGLEFILLQFDESSHSSTGCESMYLVVLLLVSVTASIYKCCSLDQ